MHRKHWWIIALLLGGGGLWYWLAGKPPVLTQQPVTRGAAYSRGELRDSVGHRLPYRLLVPERYSCAKKYPLVVVLHGAGSRGSDNAAQLRHIAPVFLREKTREDFPCFVVVPQCPRDTHWVHARYIGNRFVPNPLPTWPTQLTLQLINALQKQYAIDPSRIYLIGYSMGGSGCWDLLAKHPALFAAAVPMCGRGDTAQAARIAKLPVWVFHGKHDRQVGVSWSRDIVYALRRAHGQPRYTEYPDSGHNCWDRAIEEPQLLPWLFAQRRGR